MKEFETERPGGSLAPPTWLTHWRMRMATHALIEEATPVAALAARLGYASESAFSSAFKRVSRAPREYRRAGVESRGAGHFCANGRAGV